MYSVELRELDAMLKAAYVSKAHQTQMAERQALKIEDKQMDLAAAEVTMQQVRSAMLSLAFNDDSSQTQSCEASLVIRDHTVLPATRHVLTRPSHTNASKYLE